VAAAVPRAKRKARGRWKPLLVVALILLVLAVIADRAGSAFAAREMQSRVAGELDARNVSYGSLDVTVGGMPFLTQVAQGRLDSISIDLTQVRLTAEDRQATLPALHVVATGVLVDPVELAQGRTSATAEEVTGTAVVSYDTLSGLINLEEYHLTDIRFREENGALRAAADVSAFGVEAPIEAAVEVTLAEGQIQLRLRDAVIVGRDVPDFALSAIDMIVNAVIVAFLPPLPFGITLHELTIRPDGLAVSATGRDIVLAG
jgi:hypothetical protein